MVVNVFRLVVLSVRLSIFFRLVIVSVVLLFVLLLVIFQMKRTITMTRIGIDLVVFIDAADL